VSKRFVQIGFVLFGSVFEKTKQQFMKYRIVRTTISQFGFCFSTFSSYKILLFLKIKNGSEKKEFPFSFLWFSNCTKMKIELLNQTANRIMEVQFGFPVRTSLCTALILGTVTVLKISQTLLCRRS
jgi:hypothetical protein